MRLERRTTTPPWLRVVVPIGALAVALVLVAIILGASGHNPLSTYRAMFRAGFTDRGALSATLLNATPLVLTGLCAVVTFRMRIYNIGGEGQLYVGAVAATAVGLALGGRPSGLVIVAMIAAGMAGGALWAGIPGVLRAYVNTNEILTSLMLNYVAGLLILYLIFDSTSYWRNLTSPGAKVYPQGKMLTSRGWWPAWHLGGLAIPLGFVLGAGLAVGVTLALQYTRTGFQMRLVAGSPAAGRYAGIDTRRLILVVMLLSGALAGLAGASQVGDFSHLLDPNGLEQAMYGYAGIVGAALAGFEPLAVIVTAVFLGALTNAAVQLEGPSFPDGLVGTIEGTILFCVVSGALMTTYRVHRRASDPGPPEAPAEAITSPVETSLVDSRAQS